MPYAADTTRDAFGRFRTSEAVTLFDSQSQYDAMGLFWEHALANNGTAAHRPDEASVRLAITDDADSAAVRQTREYFRYQPGKSQFILTTFCMGPPVAGARREVGYGDAENGVFLREENGAVSMVLRSKATGSVVETVVPQAEWNAETSVGSSLEHTSLDLTKTQIFGIDLEWLGVGRVRTFFVIGGNIFYAHCFQHANVNTIVYMTTANLPVRYSIAANTTAAGAAYLDAICCSVSSEGGFERGRGIPFAAGRGATLLGITTRRPILSIRPKLTLNGITNRLTALLQSFDLIAEDKGVLVELVYNGALTSASFASVDDESAFEADTAATAITGGIVLQQSLLAAASQGSGRAPGQASLGILSRLPLVVNMAGDDRTVLSVVATAIGGTSNVAAAMNWQELH